MNFIEDEIIEFTFDGENGLRLDIYLSQIIEGISRSYVQKLIKDGRVSVNGKANDVKKHQLKTGDEVRLVLPQPELLSAQPENIPIEIVYEDDQVVVVNKQ